MPEGQFTAQSPAELGGSSRRSAPPGRAGRARPRQGDPALAAKLRRGMQGEVRFDAAARGRYATDASVYQIEPIGVACPKSSDDVAAALAIAREEGVPVLARGGGTSQCGQTVGECLVLDMSRHMKGIVSVDPGTRRARVQPGLVLDELNAALKQHGLWFPVDVSTSNRATLGGMAGNNSCGSRSIRYGTMADNVHAIDALLVDGGRIRFGPVRADLSDLPNDGRSADMARQVATLVAREQDEIRSRFPSLQRRVGGYNLDRVPPVAADGRGNMAQFLVGSEGTLALFTELDLPLQPIPASKTLGVCHFPTFYKAMDVTQHIVKLGPTAVELVDRTLIALARDIPAFAGSLDKFVRGAPDAILLVEFAEPDQQENLRRLRSLVELLADLGHPGSVVEATDPAFQREIWEIRKAGLNIMMSMKGEGKPVSFIEDCAVRLEDLAEYTRQLDEVFARHGTTGTWYAHASVGCLHVRPIINMKSPDGARTMRAIAEETFEIVRGYKGSHSGEHGDGIVRSEFHGPMFGQRMVAAFETAKAIFDPKELLNPGKIVRPYRMDDRTLLRYPPGYAHLPVKPGLDWSAWGGFPHAVEMCNNNGECRKATGGVMCPSFRVTAEEKDSTRGRANTLRLALSGQLGPAALLGEAMADTLKLCVGCKGCKRECPTGVDMARMKIEVLHQRNERRGVPLAERVVASLPRWAAWAQRLRGLARLRDRVPGLAWLGERLLGFSTRRSLPVWSAKPFRPGEEAATNPVAPSGAVALLADTFNIWFEPENLRAAVRVLQAANLTVTVAAPPEGERPLCCGRTYLAAGMIDEARGEMRRTAAALAPLLAQGMPVLGLEPSCLMTFRDELLAVLPGRESEALSKRAFLLEEYLAAEAKAGRLALPLRALPEATALLHGHCHQKAFGAMGAVEQVLRLVPGLAVKTVDSSCCGMAGAFGYRAETIDASFAMGELSLLPAVRAAAPDALVVADGTSCRHQIHDGAGRAAVHVAIVLERALAATGAR